MTHADFRIGLVFYTAAGQWRCTDVGTRVITAIKVDRPEDPNAQERWMLLQIDRVRLSYVRDVLAHDRTAPPELAWMLKQSRPVRTSYVREVLDA